MNEDVLDNGGSKGELAAELATLLGTVVTYKFLGHGFHWNVKGSDFKEYHAFFEEIYDDADDSIDPIAENIRKLGFDTPYQLPEFTQLSLIRDQDDILDDPIQMLTSLLANNEIILGQLNTVFASATMINEQGICNFIADRIDQHQKWAWQIRATLGLA